MGLVGQTTAPPTVGESSVTSSCRTHMAYRRLCRNPMAVTYLGDGFSGKPPDPIPSVAKLPDDGLRLFACSPVIAGSAPRVQNYRMRAYSSTLVRYVEWTAPLIDSSALYKPSGYGTLGAGTIVWLGPV